MLKVPSDFPTTEFNNKRTLNNYIFQLKSTTSTPLWTLNLDKGGTELNMILNDSEQSCNSVKIEKEKWIDIVDQFYKCSNLKSYRDPKIATGNIYFHTDGKFLVSSRPIDVRLVQSGKNIKLEVTSFNIGGGIRFFDTLGSVNQKFIKSKCEDVFIELENPLKADVNVTDREKQNFYFKDVKSEKVYKDYIDYGWKMHAQFIASFVKNQCWQVHHLSRSNEISKTEEAKKIKSKITNKIEQHKRYIIWSLKKEEIRTKLDENNLCSNFSF